MAGFHVREMSKKGQSIETENRLEAAWGWEQRFPVNMHEEYHQGDENALNQIMVMVA